MNQQRSQPKSTGFAVPTWGKLGLLVGFVVALSIAGYFYFGSSGSLRTLAEYGQLPANQGPAWKDIDDPSKDGWETEVLSNKIDKTLKQLAEFFTLQRPLQADRVADLVDGNFQSTVLLPAKRETAFHDSVYQVERATGLQHEMRASSFAEEMKPLVALVEGGKEIHAKFKLFRIRSVGTEKAVTTQYVTFSAQRETGMVEHNATWEMEWKLDSEKVKLLSIKLTDFELVRTTSVAGGLFQDSTLSVLDRNPTYRQQFHRGMNYWLERIQDRRYYFLLSQPGLAVGDVNGDGLEDLYVCQDEGLPNRLYLQQADGSAIEAAEAWGVNWLHSSRGVLLVDLDNDGKQDLVVATVGYLIVCQNTGFQFEVRSIVPVDDDTMSLVAADYNNDGKLDLYVCCYNETGLLSGKKQVLGGIAFATEGNRGGKNHLLRNEIGPSGWKFSNVTREAGLEFQRYTFSACWEDFDHDGWVDLYVANDYGWSQLLKNNQGKFVDISASAGTIDKGFSMSASWGDMNQDGNMDIYVGNMFSGAGGRITFQDKYLKNKPEVKSMTQRFARGNTLFKNLGNGKFTDHSDVANVTMGRWSWGCNFLDINNDGLEDIIVNNGHISTEDTGDL